MTLLWTGKLRLRAWPLGWLRLVAPARVAPPALEGHRGPGPDSRHLAPSRPPTCAARGGSPAVPASCRDTWPFVLPVPETQTKLETEVRAQLDGLLPSPAEKDSRHGSLVALTHPWARGSGGRAPSWKRDSDPRGREGRTRGEGDGVSRGLVEGNTVAPRSRVRRGGGQGSGVPAAGMSVRGAPSRLWTAEVTGSEPGSEVLPLAGGGGPKGRSWRWGLRGGLPVSRCQADQAASSSPSKFPADGPTHPPTHQPTPSFSLPPSLRPSSGAGLIPLYCPRFPSASGLLHAPSVF